MHHHMTAFENWISPSKQASRIPALASALASGLVGRLQETMPLLSSPSITQVMVEQLSVEVIDVNDGELLVVKFNSIQMDDHHDEDEDEDEDDEEEEDDDDDDEVDDDDDVSVVMSPSPWSSIDPALSSEPVLGDVDRSLGLRRWPHSTMVIESLEPGMMVCLVTMCSNPVIRVCCVSCK